jgi:hypothetical protein
MKKLVLATMLVWPFAAQADALHGQCNGTCIDNGLFTPLGNPASFGFSVTPDRRLEP